MKYMVISDIHGGINELNTVLYIYIEEKCNKLIILGDLFNYGIDLNRNKIINILNNIKNDVICVRGNCDNVISDIPFEMPYISNLKLNGKPVILTHGHLYNKDYLLDLDADIVVTGHTHNALIEKINNKILINPGSISKPRKGEKSFVIIDKGLISIRDLENNVLENYEIK